MPKMSRLRLKFSATLEEMGTSILLDEDKGTKLAIATNKLTHSDEEEKERLLKHFVQTV